MNTLSGMQISGKADIIENIGEYKILKMKGLNVDFMRNMPVNINIIKIEIKKVEFLYSKFKNEGYEAKQIYNF